MSKKSSETPSIYCVRYGSNLVGEMAADRERIAEIKEGERVRVDVRTGRVPSRLRFYWSFLHEVVKATECCPTAEALHELIKLETGYTTPVKVRGYTVLVPRSIAFSSMSEEEFTKFLQDGLRFVAETYGITPDDVEKAA
jgi:hypothetical protein